MHGRDCNELIPELCPVCERPWDDCQCEPDHLIGYSYNRWREDRRQENMSRNDPDNC